MDRISGLTDELLVKILSYLPTKVAVSTSILSTRWECVWLWLPKLEYARRRTYAATDISDSESEGESLDYGGQSLRSFLDRTMPLHRAPVIESFRLHLWYLRYTPEAVRMWLVMAVSRHLRELNITYHDYPKKQNILPSSLYACKSLVILKLEGDMLLDVPRMVCLPSLKTLRLKKVTGLDGESLRRLLSACSVLEDLLVDFCDRDSVGKISVTVLSLQILSLKIPCEGNLDGLEIDTPSLKYLKLEDLHKESYLFSIENMPKLEEAFVDVNFLDIKSLIGAIKSVKRLTICLEVVYGKEFVFDQLEDLKLCDCRACSSKLLTRFLKNSTNLRVLEIFQMDHDTRDMAWCRKPSTVPKCLVSSLQTFKWSGYLGRFAEKCIAVYILENACCLKTATISCDEQFNPKFEMLQKLSSCSRASSACKLLFH